MQRLSIHHRTSYQYHDRVRFGPHRLMLRPRESRKLRLLAHNVRCTPAAQLTWAHDVQDNTVATAAFTGASDTLTIESTAELTLDVDQWPVFDIAASAANYPFLLTQEEMTDLGALRLQSYLDSSGDLLAWARSFVAGDSCDTLTLLKNIAAGAAAGMTYGVRDDEVTQSPVQTLSCRSGSCRDFAVLFVDAVRSLGFGARIVSGYLYDPLETAAGSSGSGSTHAWADVYVPGAGWITFDPTNQTVGGHNLVPVAIARHIGQTMPVTGSYAGEERAFSHMQVDVSFNCRHHPLVR
ncbi:MAG: transglutaminase family protein [Pseudohaliea sp.]